MPAVALVGPDGAGKTTLARQLEASGLLRCRYLYMGVAVTSSNVALPTSRLAERAKHALGTGSSGPVRKKSSLRAFARLGNFVAESWYRQLLSWYLQARGFVVLYDRHFALDFAPEVVGARAGTREARLRTWFLRFLLPSPDLVLFLDAPGEVLFARKGELSAGELERRRQAFLAQGERLGNFVRVDATRPYAEVYAEVTAHVLALARREHRIATAGAA